MAYLVWKFWIIDNKIPGPADINRCVPLHQQLADESDDQGGDSDLRGSGQEQDALHWLGAGAAQERHHRAQQRHEAGQWVLFFEKAGFTEYLSFL